MRKITLLLSFIVCVVFAQAQLLTTEDFNFTPEQYDELFSVLITIPDFKLPQSSACYGSVEHMRYHYLDQKAKEIKRRDKQKPIRSKFSYLLKLMKQDAQK
jgi:hypothetical protein